MSNPGERRIFTLKNKRRLYGWVPYSLALLVRLLCRTYRTTVVDPDGYLDENGPWPCIFALWHNRILFMADFFPPHLRQRTSVLISASRDGNYVTAFIRHFGLDVVRGSTSRGGMQALRQLKRELASGQSLAITLDGPRGPRYSVQPGALALAQLSGCPVVPITINAPTRWELRSWDRMQIPKPFAKVEFRVGPAVDMAGVNVLKNRRDACEHLRQAVLAVTRDE